MTRDEAREQIARMLLDKIRGDRYPSATQMAMLEELLPRDMIQDYLDVLLEKLAEDTVPSIPMLQRVRRVADSLPLVESSG
jgi:hypothetical protein